MSRHSRSDNLSAPPPTRDNAAFLRDFASQEPAPHIPDQSVITPAALPRDPLAPAARPAATAQEQVRAQAAAAAGTGAAPAPRRVGSEPAAAPPRAHSDALVALPKGPLPAAGPGVGTPSRPYLRRPPATMFGIHVGQIIACQVAILFLLIALQQPLGASLAIGSVAFVLLILSMIRLHHRWLFQWVALWIRYASRRRQWPVPETDDRAVEVLLRAVTRGGQVESVDIDGTSAAMIRHAGGLTVLLAPTPMDSNLIVDSDGVMPALTELLPPGDDGEPVVCAQIVVHSIPAPSLLLDKSTSALSYRRLDNGPVPSQRRCWIAMQALPTLDEHTDEAVRTALISAVRRVQRRLRKAGMLGHTLNERDAAADLLHLARLDRVADGARAVPMIREHWRNWSGGGELQTSFRLLDWPALVTSDARNFLNLLSAVPTLATTITVAARRNGDELELEAAVRVTLPNAEAAELATHQVDELTREAGAHVQRLDGEQVFGLAATLPLGGFLP